MALNKEQKITFVQLAEKVLEKAEIPLSADEILKKGKDMGLEVKSDAQDKLKSFYSVVLKSIQDGGSNATLCKIGSPIRFWLKSRENEIIGKETEIELKRQEKYIAELNDDENKKSYQEKDLHPLLVKFLADDGQFGLYCKTINANTTPSKKGGLNEWIHPDIIGVHFPFSDYESGAFKLLSHINRLNYKICSFEIKKFINLANLKEYYFQAVSNSSWANKGYLVAYVVEFDDEAYDEAERLNESFGIGVIELKSEKVLFEARERELDIRTLNMLCQKNTDFRKFIENVSEDIETKNSERIIKSKYDEIFSDEKLTAHKKQCGIK